MALRAIELDPSDTFFSVRDRLLRGDRVRTVLITPGRKLQPCDVDLVLLRRLADRERLDIGLVTSDRALARQARALGLPAFANLTLAEHYRPGWRRGSRRAEWIGFLPGEERRPIDLVTGGEDIPATADRRARLWFLSGLFACFLLVGLLALSMIFLVPRAVVTLRPAALPAQVILDLSTGTTTNATDGTVVPGRTIRHAIDWEASGAITGDPTADQQRIHAQAVQGISAAAHDFLGARLEPGEMLIPSSISVEITEESFTQAGQSELILHADVTGTAVPLADLRRVAHDALAGMFPDGYEPDLNSLRLQIEPTRDALPGTFQMTANAIGRPTIDHTVLSEQLRARRAAEADDFLTDVIPLAVPPVIDLEPGWWQAWSGRLPLRAGQIEVEILP